MLTLKVKKEKGGMRRHWKPGLIRPLMKIYKSYRIIKLVQLPPGIYIAPLTSL